MTDPVDMHHLADDEGSPSTWCGERTLAMELLGGDPDHLADRPNVCPTCFDHRGEAP
jgi:hypothetical protein